VAKVLDTRRDCHYRAPELFLHAWCRRPTALDVEKPLAVAARLVETGEGEDPRILALRARVLRAAGNMREAIASLEEAESLPLPYDDLAPQLAAYRKAASPDQLTYASLDASLEAPDRLIPEGATWRFALGREEEALGPAWMKHPYDDHDWREGKSGFGYEGGGLEEGTLLEEMPGRSTTLYLRHRCTIEEPDRYATFLLEVKADDGFVAYVNGEEVGRERTGQAGTALPAALTADETAPEPLQVKKIEIPPRLLRAGENVVAVLGVNLRRDDTDFYLRPTLSGHVRPTLDRERCESLLDALERAGATSQRAYLEGRILQREGQRSDAAERFRQVLQTDPTASLALSRLAQETDDPAEWTRTLNDLGRALEGMKISPRLARTPLLPPKPASPRDGAVVGDPSVVLRATPFFAYDRTRRHVKSHWQVRTADADYERNPTVSLERSENLSSLTLITGQLLPRTRYFWRVAYVDSEGNTTAFSDEVVFTTGDFPLEPVPFDLSSVVNKDIVVNPGDQSNDAFNGDKAAIIVSGYDGRDADPSVRGLPQDRRLGVHRLQEYDGHNVLQLSSRDKTRFRITVPQSKYASVRFLVNAGWFAVWMPVTFTYADGSREGGSIPCPDIMYRFGRRFLDQCTPVWGEMMRVNLGQQVDRNLQSDTLYEVILPAREERELVALEFDAEHARRSDPRGRFNLFAVTGMKVVSK
jgi:tetratricopeptide (TPR) repeat protein